MTFGLNTVTLIGRAVTDLDIRDMPKGGRIASFKMVTNETWIDKATRERKELASWHFISVMSEFLVNDLERSEFKKGCDIMVVGTIRYDSWEDKEGVKRVSTKIITQGVSGIVRVLVKPSATPAQSSPSLDEIPF